MSVHIGKNCALGLEYVPRPAASGRTQDLWHSFSQYGPPSRQITYMYGEHTHIDIWVKNLCLGNSVHKLGTLVLRQNCFSVAAGTLFG